MGARVLRRSAASAAAAVLLAGAPNAIAASGPAWLPVAPAPAVPRSNASLVDLSPTTVLAFGGYSRPEAGTAVTGQGVPVPATDTAVFDTRTLLWRRTAPLPSGARALDRSDSSALTVLDPVGSHGYAWTLAQVGSQPDHRVVLRYTAATDRWDTFATPPVPAGRLIAAGPRLVVLDTTPDHPGTGPSGAVLDGTGHWELLPPDPFPSHPLNNPRFDELERSDPANPALVHMSPFDWFRAGVWTGTRLLLVAGPDHGHELAVAGLDSDRIGDPAAGWKSLAQVWDPRGRGELPASPVLVAGRLVWREVVYDPASGVSTPTPAAVADARVAFPGSQAVPPDGSVLGDRVVFGGVLFDPAGGATVPCPPAPELTAVPHSEDFALGSGIGGVAWVGGPGGILHFGGTVLAGAVAAVQADAPAVPAGFLRPDAWPALPTVSSK